MENKINLSYSLSSYAKCFLIAQQNFSLAEREERLLKRIRNNRRRALSPDTRALDQVSGRL